MGNPTRPTTGWSLNEST